MNEIRGRVTAFILSGLTLVLPACKPLSPTSPAAPSATATMTNTPCSSNTAMATYTPTWTRTSTPMNTPTVTSTCTTFIPPVATSTPVGPVGNIVAGTCERQLYSGFIFATSDLQLSLGGAAVTNASVALITPAGNVRMNYVSTSGDIAYYIASGFTFTPGQSYHFEVDGTSQGDFSTPPAVASGDITIPASGTPLTWTVAGDHDVVTILNGSATLYATNASGNETSPFNASPYLGASGNYLIEVSCTRSVTQWSGSAELSTTLIDQTGYRFAR